MPNGDAAANSSLGRILGASALATLISIVSTVTYVSYSYGGIRKQVQVNSTELDHRRAVYDIIPRLDERTEIMKNDLNVIKQELRALKERLSN